MCTLTEEEAQTAQEMVRVMGEATGGVVKVNPDFAASTPRKLICSLKTTFLNDLRRWNAFCKSVGSSTFLMSGKGGFTPALLWLIKDEVVEKLRQGHYHDTPEPQQKRPERRGFYGGSVYGQSHNGASRGGNNTPQNCNHSNGSLTIEANLDAKVFLAQLESERDTHPPSSMDHQLAKVKMHLLTTKRFTVADYVSWFQLMKIFSSAGDTVSIQLPTPFITEWFKTHFHERIEEIWRKENPESSVRWICFLTEEKALVA